MSGFTAGESGGHPGAQGAPPPAAGGFRVGPYRFDMGNPIAYLILWGLATLVLLALAPAAPALAVAFAAAVLLGTLFRLAK